MFLSQDGVVLATTLRAMDELGLLEPSLTEERSLRALYPEITEPGFGALRVAIRCLAGVGWLTEAATLDPDTTTLRWTEAGRVAMGSRALYVAVGEFLATFSSSAPGSWTRDWSPEQLERFEELAGLLSRRWGLETMPSDERSLVAAHLDAGVIVPTMLWLHQTGRLSGEGPTLPEGDASEAISSVLAALGWTDSGGSWTPAGEQARAFALNFGGVATYMPLLARLPELYRGELTVEPEADGSEWHVHRELNLSISSLAHKRYYGDTDAVFRELFDREPVEAQPRFIADMGCGEGTWLIHLHRLIAEGTLRGRRLGEHPLLMVGIDPSPSAMRRARENLEAAGVPALVLPGDVTDPDSLRSDLAEHGLAIEDGLHIRAFIDHERSYRGGEKEIDVPGWSTGAYLDRDGAALSGEQLERDLVAHLRRWARHTHRHGLIVLEAHCVAPQVTRRQLGALHSVALDAHQAYSKQYPVDHAAWVGCCREAGLQSAGDAERRYPSSRPFVAVSVSRLLAPGAGTPLPAIEPGLTRANDGWRPEPGADLEDGRALHEILFAGGDIRYPAMWHSAATGSVVSATLDAIEGRLATAKRGEVIRILDYGAGTGTASIELLKACRERGLEARLGRLGVELELHLVDLPSSWFAQGFELLRECAWTRFHSLRASDGGFRPLPDVTGGQAMDVAMANMVFHLIPPRALERASEGLADAMAPNGRLIWSSPDLGPAGSHAVLLHEPNRELRRRWLAALGEEADAGDPLPVTRRVAQRVRAELDAEAMEAARERARRRILPSPTAEAATAALEGRFVGEAQTRGYEMLADDIVSGLLVPSNQAEYLPEIADRATREQVIRELMVERVIPDLQDGPAGTALGLNLHWTFGDFVRR